MYYPWIKMTKHLKYIACIYQLLSLIYCKWYLGSFVFFVAKITNASKDWDNARLLWL